MSDFFRKRTKDPLRESNQKAKKQKESQDVILKIRQTFFDKKPKVLRNQDQCCRLIDFPLFQHSGYISKTLPKITQTCQEPTVYEYDPNSSIGVSRESPNCLFEFTLTDETISIEPMEAIEIETNPRILFIYGPTGSGKTSLAKGIYELNTSVQRNYKSLMQLKSFDKLLIDDVDVLFKSDDQFWKGIEELSKITRLILTSSNYMELDYELDVDYLQICRSPFQVRSEIKRIAYEKGYLLNDCVFKWLGEGESCTDIRKAKNNLEFWFQGKRNESGDVMMVDMKQKKSLFNVFENTELKSLFDQFKHDEVDYENDLIMHCPVISLEAKDDWSLKMNIEDLLCSEEPRVEKKSDFIACYNKQKQMHMGGSYIEMFAGLSLVCKMNRLFGVDDTRKVSKRRKKRYPIGIDFDEYEVLCKDWFPQHDVFA